MDIQQLRYTVALSQELHFNRAAARVHVTQPTLSQGIKKLEDEIGTRLFERSPQAVRLTAAGKVFLPYAISILDQLNKGIDAVRHESKEISGVLKIGAIPTICPYLIPPTLIKVRREAPKLRVELYEEKTADILEHLKSGFLDLGVLALPINDSTLSARSIGEESFFVALSRKHPLAGRSKLTIKEVVNDRLLILQEGHCFGDQTMEVCKLQRNDPQVVFQGSSLTSVIKLAAAGDGVTFVPKMATLTNKEPGVKYIPLSAPAPQREIGVIWRASNLISKAQSYFMDAVAEALAKIV